MTYIDDVNYLNEQLPSLKTWKYNYIPMLKDSKKAFIGHITRLKLKIQEAIENLENTEKILFLAEQLKVARLVNTKLAFTD